MFYLNPSYQNTRSLISEGVPVWAQWTYNSLTYKEFAQRDLDRVRQNIHNKLVLFWCLAALPGLVGTILLLLGKGDGFGWDLLIIAGVITFFTGIQGFVHYSSAQQLYDVRRKGPYEIRITPIGVNEAGQDIILVAANRSLLRVYIHGKDWSVIRFRVEDGRGGPQSLSLWPLPTGEMWVLIPEGHEAEARVLADIFQREVVRTQPKFALR